MFLVVELGFIILLVMVLFMLYRNERAALKNSSPQAKAQEYWNGKERRKHVRFKKTLEINYAVRKKSRLKNGVKTLDISEGGMKLIIDEKLEKGTILDLKVPLSDSNRIIEIEGEVIWCEETPEKEPSGKRLFCSGVMFRAMKDPSDNESLTSYILSLPLSTADKI